VHVSGGAPGRPPAYRGRVDGGGAGTTEGWRARLVAGRPNWWVVLALSLALMALLVATAPAPPASRVTARDAASPPDLPHRSAPSRGAPAAATTTRPAPTGVTTTSVTPRATLDTVGPTPGATTASPPGPPSPRGRAAAPAGTTTTTAAASTPASSPAAVPAVRTQTQGYLDPPLTTSNVFAFDAAGTTQVAAVWSGGTYLTMDLACASGSQSVGGSGAMAATLPGASGSCTATVREPATESTAVTYALTIGPVGG
jgi:hypothetical protein